MIIGYIAIAGLILGILFVAFLPWQIRRHAPLLGITCGGVSIALGYVAFEAQWWFALESVVLWSPFVPCWIYNRFYADHVLADRTLLTIEARHGTIPLPPHLPVVAVRPAPQQNP